MGFLSVSPPHGSPQDGSGDRFGNDSSMHARLKKQLIVPNCKICRKKGINGVKRDDQDKLDELVQFFISVGRGNVV